MPERPPVRSAASGTVVGQRPTTLSARAMDVLSGGARDPVALMRQVCRVEQLTREAAERMARALLGHRPEFVEGPDGLWRLTPGVTPPERSGTSDQNPRHAAPMPLAVAPDGRSPVVSSGFQTLRFAVVDVETTGTHAASGDRITEIAIAQVERGAVTDVYSTLVNPERRIPQHITALTGIDDAMVRGQPPFRAVAAEVAERLGGRIFVAHNAAFDWRFVREELGRCAVDMAGPTLCTVRLARALLPQLPRRSLDHVTRYFGISITARHRAAGDAEATAQVLLRLLGCAEDAGITTWPDLHAWLTSPRARRAGRTRRSAFPTPVLEDDVA